MPEGRGQFRRRASLQSSALGPRSPTGPPWWMQPAAPACPSMCTDSSQAEQRTLELETRTHLASCFHAGGWTVAG